MSDKFTVEIISPDQTILKLETNEVIIPSYEGEMGILKNHIPLITFLRPGIIIIKNHEEKKYFVEDGTVEFSENNLLILTSTAKNLATFSNTLAWFISPSQSPCYASDGSESTGQVKSGHVMSFSFGMAYVARPFHLIGERRRPGVAQPGDNASSVGGRPILRHFPFAGDLGQGDFHTDNRPQHAGDKVVRRVVDRPGRGLVGLKPVGQGADMGAQTVRVGEGHGCAAGMHGGVVPGRHDFAMVGFRGVPIGRDVTFRPVENRQYRAAKGEAFGMRVGARQMTAEQSPGRRGGDHFNRHMASEQAIGALADQGGGGEPLHRRRQQDGIVLAKMSRHIHRPVLQWHTSMARE